MYDFFQCVAESLAENGLRGAAALIPGGGFLFDVAKAAWQKYRQKRQLEKMRDDVQHMIMATPEEVKQVAGKIAKEVAQNVAKEAVDDVREKIETYLTQIPAAARQSLKRAEDETGTSVPAAFALRNEDDLAQLLPPDLPRFKTGDALPGRPGWLLERYLAGGGFGEVWLARGAFGIEGAVKFFHDLKDHQRDLLHERNVIARIRKEARHPNVVALLDAHLDGDAPWLMYEYVDGGDLGDFIRRLAGLAPAKRAERVVTALQLLAKAVGRFHGLNPPIVHRDLKPANILYDRAAKQLRITDFGIGGVAAAEIIDSEKHGSLTRAARLQSYLYGSCTPLYASPEQKRGDPPDPKDDVHALGVLAYQMLTVQMTHGVGPDFADDLRELQVEESLIDLVRRCCARADRRLKDAGKIVEALATPPPPPPVGQAFQPDVSPSPQPAKPNLPPPRQAGKPDLLGTPKPGDIITNSLGMKLAWIPPGTFMMGSPTSELERYDNETQHKVTLTQGFYLGVH